MMRAPGTRDDAVSLREAKARVQHEIELQRGLLEQFDRADAEGTAASDVTGGEDPDRWYARETAKLARLKDEQYQLRLRGGEFYVRNQSGVGMILEVAASGRITLYEQPAEAARERSRSSVSGSTAAMLLSNPPLVLTPALGLPPPQQQRVAPGLTPSASVLSMFAMVDASTATAADAAAEGAGPTSASAARLSGVTYRKPSLVVYINSLLKVRPVETAGAGNSGTGAPSGLYDRLVRLDFKNGSMALAVTDAEELLQVLGSHLLRYNHHKVNQIRRLVELHELKTTPFSRFCSHHELLLHRLWAALLPGEPAEPRISERWKLLGFQSKDPSADLRGMGMLGLHTLVYFAETHTTRCQEIALGHRPYPFAAVGINVTQMCCALVSLTDDVVRLPPSDPKWGTPALTFLSYVENENAFEELFCVAYELLDLVFVRLHAEYMDFPTVYDRVQQQLKDMLERSHPLSFHELRGLVDWTVA